MIPNNKIELSVRRNILDAFLVAQIAWYGELEQPNFLGRLFDLSNMPSRDPRYRTAGEDITKHTVYNNDWPDEWVFTDERFNLLHVRDDLFLDFLCLTIHPTVRRNQEQIVTLLEIYNNNISKNGYEIIEVNEIAGKSVYGPREIVRVSTPTINLTQSKKLALVMGCSLYRCTTHLTNPTNDANGIEKALKGLNFEVIKIIDPTQKELKETIDEFGDKLKDIDVGLCYFAGHGVQIKGLNYLIPVDANLKSERLVEYDCVEVNRILAHMEDSRTDVNVIILDACRNNPFERSWGRGISLRGLATMNAPKGSLIAYSTSPGTTASDGEGENGLYTESLLSHIGEKRITVTTMFQKVRTDVITRSGNEQIPWESTSLTRDFYFNP